MVVALDTGIQFGLRCEEVLLGGLIGSSDGIQLLLGELHKFGLFLLRKARDGGDFLLDSLQDQGEEGVLLVVHESLGQSFDGGVQDYFLDIFSVGSFEGLLQLLEGDDHESLQLFGLVGLLVGLSALQDVQGTLSDVVLELQVLVG